MAQIENIDLSKDTSDRRGIRNGLTDALNTMRVGQSVFIENATYTSAHVCINAAKRRIKNPVKGSFRVVPEADGVRVGRVG